MSKVTITTEINSTDVNHLEALNVFLHAIGGQSVTTANDLHKATAEALDTAANATAKAATMEVVADKVAGSEDEELTKEQIEQWSVKEMGQMDTSVLKDACDILGIDYEAYDGMNTNKKLRDLIASKGAAPAAQTKPAATEAPAAQTKPAATTGDAPTLDDVRAALSANVGEHRDALKAEITRLGAKNLTQLDPSKYQDFINFTEML